MTSKRDQQVFWQAIGIRAEWAINERTEWAENKRAEKAMNKHRDGQVIALIKLNSSEEPFTLSASN